MQTKHTYHYLKNVLKKGVFAHLPAGIFNRKRLLAIAQGSGFKQKWQYITAQGSTFKQKWLPTNAQVSVFNQKCPIASAHTIVFNQKWTNLSAQGTRFNQKCPPVHLLKPLLYSGCSRFSALLLLLHAKNSSGLINRIVTFPASFQMEQTPGT